MAININDKTIINPLPIYPSGNVNNTQFNDIQSFNTDIKIKERNSPIYNEINKENKTEYLTTSNSVKLLPYFTNYNQYIMLYTELSSNLKLGDRVYLLFDSTTILDTNDIILDSYLTFSGYTDIFYYVKATHGYKVIDIDTKNNIVVIDKLYLEEYKNKTISGHYLTKTYIKNIYFKGGNIDGAAILNCQLNESGTTVNDINIIQSIILSGDTYFVTFKDKYDNNYNCLKSMYNDINDDNTINKTTYLNLNNDKRGFSYIKENNITGSTIYNGIFYKCVLKNCTIYDGLFEDCEINNCTVNGGYFKNVVLLPNCTWLNGIWFEDLYTGKTFETTSGFGLNTWINGTWNGGNFYNKIWLTGIFNNGNFFGSNMNNSQWYNGVFNNGKMFNTRWYNGIVNNGELNTIEWLNGKLYNGLFVNGIWSGGTFYNGEIRLSNWLGGDFNNGLMNLSNFYSGNFYNGEIIGSDLNNNPEYIFEWIDGIFHNGKMYGMAISNISFHSGNMESCFLLGGSYYGGKSKYCSIYSTLPIDIIRNMNFEYTNIYNPTSTFNVLIENCTFKDLLMVITNDGNILFDNCVFTNVEQEPLSSNISYVTMNKCKFNNGIFGHNFENNYYGDWYQGDWYYGTFNGNWYGGTFYNGIFNGYWYGGTWISGKFNGFSPQPLPIPPIIKSEFFLPYTKNNNE